MNVVEHTLKQLRIGLTNALPDRIVSEDFINHDQRNRDEIFQGIVTVLLKKIRPSDDWSSYLDLIIIGQIEVSQRDSHPHDAERAELKLYHELRRYLRNATGLPHISLEDVKFSAQIEHPFGWVAIDARCGPINEACIEGIDDPDEIFPPDVNVGALKTGHFDIDIRPHESDEEHQKWLKGDYSDSQPEAQIDVEFKT